MATIVTRAGKGTPLTNAEVDANFTNLNDDKVEQTAATGSAVIPAGSDAQRDSVPAAGYFRFNTTSQSFEGHNGVEWGAIGGGGGATGGGSDQVFVENDQVVTESYTIPVTKNAMSTGPITVTDGANVVVSDGTRWIIL
jgi:hypothetical protein